MVLKPCGAGTTREGDPSEEAREPIKEDSLESCLGKRKAELDPEDEEEEESGGEMEEDSEERARTEAEKREAARLALLEVPEWDVDSFDGVVYSSSSEPDLASDEQPYDNMENAREHYRIYKQQLINSKGFLVDRGLRPSDLYKGITPLGFNNDEGRFLEHCEKMVSICLEKHNQDKASSVEFVQVVRGNYRGGPRPKTYITFMAREKPDGPLVEYQAKGMATLDKKMHPILCRPAPTPN